MSRTVYKGKLDEISFEAAHQIMHYACSIKQDFLTEKLLVMHCQNDIEML